MVKPLTKNQVQTSVHKAFELMSDSENSERIIQRRVTETFMHFFANAEPDCYKIEHKFSYYYYTLGHVLIEIILMTKTGQVIKYSIVNESGERITSLLASRQRVIGH